MFLCLNSVSALTYIPQAVVLISMPPKLRLEIRSDRRIEMTAGILGVSRWLYST